jgi:hypothetical protein
VADRDEWQAEVTDLGEEAVQRCLIGNRPGDQGLAGRVAP